MNRGGDAAQPVTFSTISPYIVEIHGPREVEITIGVEPARQCVAVIMQITLDVERWAERRVKNGSRCKIAAEAVIHAFFRVVGDHTHHAGDGESARRKDALGGVRAAAPVGISHDGAAPDLVHGDALGIEAPVAATGTVPETRSECRV